MLLGESAFFLPFDAINVSHLEGARKVLEQFACVIPLEFISHQRSQNCLKSLSSLGILRSLPFDAPHISSTNAMISAVSVDELLTPLTSTIRQKFEKEFPRLPISVDDLANANIWDTQLHAGVVREYFPGNLSTTS
jgi:hypothetical protein